MEGKSVRQKTTVRKPVKPHPDYPLTPHATGQFCKKIRGNTHYFGSDPDDALRRYLEQKDYLLAGLDPNAGNAGETLEWLCNTFMDSRQSRLDRGELAPRTLDDYHATCKRLVKFFGKSRRLNSLRPLDFGSLKGSYPTTWGPTTISNEIARVRVIIKYAYDIDAIDRPIKIGPDFKQASRKTMRLQKRKQPKKEFTPQQLWQLIDRAGIHLKAMTLLGVNAAYGIADIGRLRIPWIDFENGWLGEMRHKTGVERQAWLWPETIKALQESIRNRPEPKDPAHDDLAFITKYGNPWHREGARHSALSTRFTQLMDSIGINAKGVSFYCLRHVFETIGGDSKDQIAVDYVMGHVDDSMADTYREGIDPQRVIDVCEHVRAWWLSGKP